ncbi:MAG TPA: vWA domain-containing protein, partial [Polyangia bacterium]|nr:vWA domain-containing protein [Polyangia bacterium]
MNHSTRRALLFLPAVLAGVLSFAPQARAEFCWDYVDNTPAKLPVVCVRQDALMCMPSPTNTCCSYNASCAKNNGGNTGSCCTLVPPTASTPPQTMLAMHTAWHECFGNTGGNPRETGPNDPLLPYPGRGARWLAFHRQFEYDFDLAREDPNGPKHEACDPMTNKSGGCWIEHLDWHKDMIFPYGHAGKSECDTMKGVCKTRFDDMGKPFPCTTDAQCHVAGCGVGNVRPAPVTCSNCVAPPECLYLRGGGPNKGGEAPTAGCVGFKRFEADPATGKLVTPLDEIPTLDEVAKILDTNEHASFHTQVGIPFPGANFIPDVLDPVCSPRDPMFWRLHKRLDDTVRAWQKRRPMDLSVVIDRSGSMSETDSSGKSKIAMVKDAVELIAALMPDNNGSKIGMVTFSDGATPDIGLTPSAQAPAAFSPILNALPGRVGGCTSIGSGLDQAATQLTSAAAANERKGIILLTDGQENRAPCLNSVGAATPNCGSTCGGGQFDISKVGVHTQLCAIGFGQAGSLNGPLLTAVAERQGGIYIQSPAKGPNDHEGMSGQGTWLDVKDFFVKCFGQVADEFEGVDPKGTLPRRQLASDPMTYSTCDDERLTFVGGWDAAESAGNLFMQVNTPSGDLVRVDDPAIENTDASKFSFVRAPLPFKGQQSGTWRAQLIRGHSTYVNGFTTDSLPTSTSVPLVRRQIQRICPVGCDKVLYYEDGHLGAQSSYALAVQAEQQSGLLTNVTTTTDANDFKSKLESPNSWNLIVYAHQMTDQVEP